MSKDVMDKMINDLKNANTNTVRKSVIENTRSILTDEELENVTGGSIDIMEVYYW